MDKTRTTNLLLLVIVVPLVFYLLKILSFIFIPLAFSMFIALLFLPLMRWLGKKGVPKYISIFIVILLILLGLGITAELIHLSSKQILSSDSTFFAEAEVKLRNLKTSVESYFGVELGKNGNLMAQIAETKNIGSAVGFIGGFLSMSLTTAFFTVLWLAESINVQKLLNATILKQKHTSVKTFLKIENDLIKFIKVKFLVSLGTGIFTGLACVYFDVSFPIFWGLFAFVINFVQMIGSFISVISLSLFAFVELDPTSTLLFFMLSITLVQVIFGAILEPIFMGKSFSINIIAVLVMLMFWGFIWGIPGMIMSIPITVFLKIILEQFPNTKIIAGLLSGKELKINR
ncbi:AI-2E family transporter [uncultured Gelidibacter sp.]|uniref:AI-2E family transporter n=1 Tax=uncultured Gelidibacter sp. TaxID=259318 RepID=UPI00261E49DD|nr:AI-2E family transporter [uncultured Gelidibacter sp.]